jgi:hypothetical protein
MDERVLALKKKKIYLENELIKTNSILIDKNLEINSCIKKNNAIKNETNNAINTSFNEESYLYSIEKEICQLEKLVVNARKNLMLINSFRV